MAVKNLEGAFVDELRDMLSAEKQIEKALKKMAKKAESDELVAAFEEHLEQTQGQIERIEEAFASLDRKPSSKRCEAIKGIIDEGEELAEEASGDGILDALLIAAAQKVEHYEMASYGTLCAWAELLGYDQAGELLSQNLDEEKETDEKLTKLASKINETATAA